jgi:hypothetical protein
LTPVKKEYTLSSTSKKLLMDGSMVATELRTRFKQVVTGAAEILGSEVPRISHEGLDTSRLTGHDACTAIGLSHTVVFWEVKRFQNYEKLVRDALCT